LERRTEQVLPGSESGVEVREGVGRQGKRNDPKMYVHNNK
jgi:hypothetical protein